MKISIYVPEERAGDIEKWRETLNFSQLFLQALDREITLRSQLSRIKDREMKAVIERLKAASSKAAQQGRLSGVAQGVEAAKDHLDLNAIRLLAEDNVSNLRSFLECDYDSVYDADHFFRQLYDDAVESGDVNAFNKGWDEGFREGVQSVWQQIREAFV